MDNKDLKFFYEMSKNEVDFLRDRQYKIFIWISTILLTIIGLLLISDKDKNLIFDFSNITNKLIFTFIILFVAVSSMYWIYRNRSWHKDQMLIITKIGKMLKAYEKDYYLNDKKNKHCSPKGGYLAIKREKPFL